MKTLKVILACIAVMTISGLVKPQVAQYQKFSCAARKVGSKLISNSGVKHTASKKECADFCSEKSPPKQNPGKTPASQPKESSRPTIQPKMRWSTFPKISITTQQTAKKESFKSTKSRSTILVTRATQPSTVKHFTTSQRTTTRYPLIKMRQSSREATTARYPQNKTEFSIEASKSGMLDQTKVSTTTKIVTAVDTHGLKMSVDTNLQATAIVSEPSLSQREAAKNTKNENNKESLAVPVSAGVCGGLVLLLALIVGLVIGHRRYNIFKTKPNSKQINSHKYNNPAYSTQETTNRYSEIDIVQTPNPYENSSSLPQHESEIYYSEVANESSAEEKADNVYYEPQTAYGDSGEASLSVVSSQAGLRDSTGDTEIYFLADEVKDDLVVVDNDLYGT